MSKFETSVKDGKIRLNGMAGAIVMFMVLGALSMFFYA